MESGSKVVKSGQNGLQRLAVAFSGCSSEAAVYGACVARKEMVARDDCLKEFNALSSCVKSALTKRR